MVNINLGIVTTTSYKGTCNYNTQRGDYNMFRAHGYNCARLANKLSNKILHDIGENKTEYTIASDDLGLISTYTDFKVVQSKFEEFATLEGFNIVILLHVDISKEDTRKYINKVIDDDRIHGIIYYNSDDEIFVDDYILSEGCNMDFKGKLLCILNGHNYVSIDSKVKTFYLPMIPIRIARNHFREIEPKVEFDYYLDCFHHTRVLDRLVKSNPDKRFLIGISSDLIKYVDRVNYPNAEFHIFEGRTSDLTELITTVKRCKCYLIPNTYSTKNSWYEEYYMQMIMYTNKILIGYYADVPVRSGEGDLVDVNIPFPNLLPLRDGYMASIYVTVNIVEDEIVEHVVSRVKEIELQQIEPEKVALIIAPHIDDELYSCWSVMDDTSYDKIYVLVLTNNKYQTLRKKAYTDTRVSDLIRTNIEFITTEDDNDGKLYLMDKKEAVTMIDSLLTEIKPTHIFLPEESHHQDHTTTHQLSMAAMRPRAGFNPEGIFSYSYMYHDNLERNVIFKSFSAESLERRNELLRIMDSYSPILSTGSLNSIEYLTASNLMSGRVINEEYAERFIPIRVKL